MRFFLKAIAGLVVAFLAQIVVIAACYLLFGERMLGASGWTDGMRLPASFMISVVVAATLGGMVAGVLAALIVRRDRIRHALAYGVLLTGLDTWLNRATLFANPPPNEWR